MWNMFLIILTYCLVLYGTFIVRSGVISSVHSFAQSAIGPLFFGFIGFMFIFSAYWLTKRRRELATPNQLQSVFSREAAFLLNNFIILGILFATFWGTNFPILSELFTGEKATVGAPFYNKVNGPLFAVLLLLMGVAPLMMWYRTSLRRLQLGLRWPALAALALTALLFLLGVRSWGALLGFYIVFFSLILTLLEFWKGMRARMRGRKETPWTALSSLIGRNRRRYGGYWIHLGVLIMAFGIVGSYFFQQETQVRLQRGDSVSLGNYSMTFNGISRYPGPDDLIITEANVAVYYNGEYVKDLNPRTELYTRTNQPMTIPKARSTVAEDFYILLVNWEQASESQATFRIYLNPLINWVWAGGIVFILGTLIAAWPDPVDERAITAARARRRLVAQPTGD